MKTKTTFWQRRSHSTPLRCSTLQDKRRRNRALALRRRQESNYAINLAFLETYARENGYEDFRDQVICLDYDELLEMYVEETVHPAVRPPWQSPGNYAYFQSEVMGQIA